MDNQFLNTNASDGNSRTIAGADSFNNVSSTQPASPPGQVFGGQAPTVTPARQPWPNPQPRITPAAERQIPSPSSKVPRWSPKTKLIGIIGLVGLIVIGAIAAFMLTIGRSPGITPGQSIDDFGSLNLPLEGLSSTGNLALGNRSLSVNGQLRINGSLVMTPSVPPPRPVTGQLYYDQTSNHLNYYNGAEFVELLTAGDIETTEETASGGGTTIVNNTTTTTTSGQGGNFAILDATQTFTGINTFQNNFQVQNSAGTNLLAVNATANDIAVGSSGPTTVTLGSATGTSTTNLNAGTGNLTVSTGAATDTSGSISIKTGDSSTTASGNIEIDAGAGIIDGEIVSVKDFEDGLDNMEPWFGTTVSQTTEQARTGTHSLKETGTSPFEGIIENINNPITPVTPGHQYFFSFWVRAATVPRSVSITVHWQNTAIAVPMTPTVDSTAEWTQITGTAQAPAGSTAAYINITHPGANGEVHYFDDFTITDLSAGAAISAINIGATNAKVITIGNMNQVGATSIYGNSGINMNSGASSTTLNAGAISLSGSAASTFSTSGGALTLTSAASATWGIATASSGAGGDLTLKGGNGAASNDNGGDLTLQGGNATGTGIGGSVIVKPLADSAGAFQVQNSSGTTFLNADSSNMNIAVTGTDSAFASLTLTDAHFESTQTTAPTISTPTDCGTAPTAVVTAGSTDSAGSFTITAGSGAVTGPCVATVTFHQAYGAAPKSVIITPTTSIGTSPQGKTGIVSAATTNNFSVTMPTNPAAAEANSYYYWVIE